MKLVLVKFYDHCWGNKVEIPVCTVFGELCDDLSDNICLVVRVWRTDREDTPFDPHNGDQEYANILRDAVIEISHLREVAEMAFADA